MKGSKRLFYLVIFLLASSIVSFAGRYPGKEALPPNVKEDGLRIVFSFDTPDKAILPFPNDLVWSIAAKRAGLSEAFVVLPVEEASSAEEAALYALVNAARFKGFSPNMFITVPISKNTPLTNVDGHYRLIDLTDLQTCAYSGFSSPSCSSVDDTNRLVFRQMGYLLRFYPVEPLDPGHQYVFVLLKGIVSKEGELLGKPWNAQIFDSVTPLEGPIEEVRAKFGYLYDVLSAFNPVFSRDNVLVLVPFTVASKTLSSKAFALMQECIENYADVGKEAVAQCVVEGYSQAPQVYTLSYGDADGDGILDVGKEAYGLIAAIKVLFGTYHQVNPDSAAFCSSFVDYGRSVVKSFKVSYLAVYAEDILKAYKLGDTASLATYVQQLMQKEDYRENVPFRIYGSTNYDGTLLMYQHGLGGDKSIGQVVSYVVGKTVLAMDLPWHGDRVAPTGPCSKSGVCFLTPNIPQDRINFYQAILDQTVLMLVARSGCLDLNGDGFPGDIPAKFFYSGISLGGITGSMFTSLNYDLMNGLGVDKAVLNVGGGNYAALVDEAKRAAIQKLICKTIGGEKYGFDCADDSQASIFADNARLYLAYDITMGLLQTLLDPSDPSYVVRAALGGRGDFIGKVILQSAFGDTFVPNVSNEALARAFGYSQVNTVMSVLDVSTSPGWYMFGDESNWAVHSFAFTAGLYQLCGLPEDAMEDQKLACLLHIYPELQPYEDYINPSAIEALMNASWYQLKGFFWSE